MTCALEFENSQDAQNFFSKFSPLQRRTDTDCSQRHGNSCESSPSGPSVSRDKSLLEESEKRKLGRWDHTHHSSPQTHARCSDGAGGGGSTHVVLTVVSNNGVRTLRSRMDRMRALSGLTTSHNNIYDQQRLVQQPSSPRPDIPQVSRIFSIGKDNHSSPTAAAAASAGATAAAGNRGGTEAGFTVVTGRDIADVVAGEVQPWEAPTASGMITFSPRGLERRLSSTPEGDEEACRGEDDDESRHQLTKVDSFDDENPFQRLTSVSLSQRAQEEGLRTASATRSSRFQAESGVSTPGESSLQRGNEEELSSSAADGPAYPLVGANSYDFRNDEILTQPPSSGCDTDGDSGKSRRKSGHSFEFGNLAARDPPTKLIGAFLQRQTESGSHILDLDLDMAELASSPTVGGGLSLETEEKNGSPQTVAALGAASSPGPNNVTAGHPVGGESGGRQNVSNNSSPFASSPLREGNHDVTINVGRDHRGENGIDEFAATAAAAAAFARNSPRRNGEQSVRWRPNGHVNVNDSFKVNSPRLSGADGEVLKAPVQYAVRPSFSRMKSRLSDIPKPPEDVAVIPEEKLKSGQVKISGQMKSGLMGGKLKKVTEEEEEDPLKVSDLPEKYHKRDKGPWTIIQCLAFLVIIAGLVTILVFPSLRNKKKGGLVLWKWALLVMVVFSGRLISGWIIWLLVFIIERNFLLRKRVVYFVYALRKGVQNCLWLGFALLAWHLMIDPKVDNNLKVVWYVTKVLICFLIAAILILVKTLIVKVFASSFHVNNYFERIQEALFNQYIMETLSNPPMIDIEYDETAEDEERKFREEIAGLKDAGASGPSLSKIPDLPPKKASGVGPRPSFAGSGMIGSGMIGSGTIGGKGTENKNKPKSRDQKELNKGISVEYLQKLDMTNISAWNMKRLIHIVKNSTLTHCLEESAYAEGMETEIQSEWQAKCAAKQIFKNVARPHQKVILEDDLLRFMREEETKKAWTLFDGATERKCITKQALKNWVISVYRERRALALTLNDTKTAVNKLHRIVDVVVGVIIIVISLLVLGIATTKLLLFMSSQILLLILVWGNTLKTVFEAIVFLFVMHPFDVGDRCVVDGMQLVVEEMNILTTVFIGDFNVKIWFPNAVLATKPIQNFYRSPEMGDGVDFIVHSSTPMDKIAAFKEKMARFIESKPEHWHEDFSLNILAMTEGERMKLSLGVKHTMNYQDMGEIVKRRSDLFIEMKLCLHELGIEYHLPAQELHITKFKDSTL